MVLSLERPLQLCIGFAWLRLSLGKWGEKTIATLARRRAWAGWMSLEEVDPRLPPNTPDGFNLPIDMDMYRSLPLPAILAGLTHY
jgi:hypothetical protein